MEEGLCIRAAASLEAAMPVFDRADVPYLPVVMEEDGKEQVIGALYQVDALKAYNRALAAIAAEEHR